MVRQRLRWGRMRVREKNHYSVLTSLSLLCNIIILILHLKAVPYKSVFHLLRMPKSWSPASLLVVLRLVTGLLFPFYSLLISVLLWCDVKWCLGCAKREKEWEGVCRWHVMCLLCDLTYMPTSFRESLFIPTFCFLPIIALLRYPASQHSTEHNPPKSSLTRPHSTLVES